MLSEIYFLGFLQGAIMVPHHHSRSTLVGLVVEGSGHFEMVCPHFSSHGGDDDDDGNEEKNNRLQVNRAVFSPGDVFVVAAGHPISYIPDPYQNLTILEFGINGLNNHRNFIAGTLLYVQFHKRFFSGIYTYTWCSLMLTPWICKIQGEIAL